MRHIYNAGACEGSPPAAKGPHKSDPHGRKTVAHGEFELRTRLLIRPTGSAIIVKSFSMETPHDDQETAELGPSLMKLVKLGYVRILLNLEGVHFASGSLLGNLASVHREVERAGGFLILFGLAPIIRDALRICRLDRVIVICENEAEAISAYHLRRSNEKPSSSAAQHTR